MRTINKLPLMAFALGLGLITVMGMSSFKEEKRVDQRYYDTGSGWKTEAEIISENPEFHPVCTQGDPTLCSAIYSDTETPGIDTPESPNFGTYQLIPD